MVFCSVCYVCMCTCTTPQGIPGIMRGLIWNYLSGAHADPQLKESYRLLVMKVCACVRVCMEVSCVHGG